MSYVHATVGSNHTITLKKGDKPNHMSVGTQTDDTNSKPVCLTHDEIFSSDSAFFDHEKDKSCVVAHWSEKYKMLEAGRPLGATSVPAPAPTTPVIPEPPKSKRKVSSGE